MVQSDKMIFVFVFPLFAGQVISFSGMENMLRQFEKGLVMYKNLRGLKPIDYPTGYSGTDKNDEFVKRHAITSYVDNTNMDDEEELDTLSMDEDKRDLIRRIILTLMKKQSDTTEVPEPSMTYNVIKSSSSATTTRSTGQALNQSSTIPKDTLSTSTTPTASPPETNTAVKATSQTTKLSKVILSTSTKPSQSPTNRISTTLKLQNNYPNQTPSTNQDSSEYESNFFRCPFFEPLLFEYFRHFPRTDDVIEATNFTVEQFHPAIEKAVKLYSFTRNYKLASYQLAEDVAKLILDERIRCPATKFQNVIVYVIKEEVHRILNSDKSQYDTIQMILRDHLPQEQSSIIPTIAKMLLLSAHSVIFEELVSSLQMEEFRELATYLTLTREISRDTFRRSSDDSVLLKDLKQQFEHHFYLHADVYKCTTPGRLMSVHDEVIEKKVKEFLYFEQAGLLVDFGTKFVTELFSAFNITTETKVIIQLAQTAVQYLQTTVQKLEVYQKNVANHDVEQVIKFLERHLPPEKVQVAIQFLRMMGMYPTPVIYMLADLQSKGVNSNYWSTEREIAQMNDKDLINGGHKQFVALVQQKLQHDVQQLEELVRLVQNHNGTHRDLRTEVLILAEKMLVQKKTDILDMKKLI